MKNINITWRLTPLHYVPLGLAEARRLTYRYKKMNQLPIPKNISDDQNATEMIRLWISKNDIHVSKLLGKWEESHDGEITEKEAWGQLLAKLIRDLSIGMSNKYGFEKEETERAIVYSLLHHLNIRINNTVGSE